MIFLWLMLFSRKDKDNEAIDRAPLEISGCTTSLLSKKSLEIAQIKN
jgi:hypothetical protein